MTINFTQIIKSSTFIYLIKKYNYKFSKNDIVGGKIIAVEEKGFLIDIGTSALAYLPCEEFFETIFFSKKNATNLYKKILLHQKNEISEFILISYNDKNCQAVISLKKFRAISFWKRLNSLTEENMSLWGRVYKSIDQGKFILIQQSSNISTQSLKTFIYKFQLPKYYRRKESANFLIPLKMLKTNEKKNQLFLSCRLACFQYQIKFIKTKQILVGCIVEIKRYGLLINVSGVKSLLHISKISNTKVENLIKLFKVGDLIQVSILYIDNKKGRLVLTKKNL